MVRISWKEGEGSDSKGQGVMAASSGLVTRVCILRWGHSAGRVDWEKGQGIKAPVNKYVCSLRGGCLRGYGHKSRGDRHTDEL